LSKKRKGPREAFDYQPPIEQEQEPRNEPKYRLKMAYLIDQDEVNQLIEASQAPYVDEPKEFELTNYSTYVEEEVVALLAGEPYRRKRFKKKSVSETT
jgi:hypothetical protein